MEQNGTRRNQTRMFRTAIYALHNACASIFPQSTRCTNPRGDLHTKILNWLLATPRHLALTPWNDQIYLSEAWLAQLQHFCDRPPLSYEKRSFHLGTTHASNRYLSENLLHKKLRPDASFFFFSWLPSTSCREAEAEPDKSYSFLREIDNIYLNRCTRL